MAGFELNVRDNIEEFTRRLDDIQRKQVPFVTAYALTKTAQDVKEEEVQVMAQVFDRPTRFTLNSLYVRSATKQSLVAAVLFKEGFGSVPAWRYLGPQVMGGPRVKKAHERALERAGILKSHEFVVPGVGLKVDAYGNVRGGNITRILSGLSASSDPQQNITTRSKKRNSKRARYFVVRGSPRAPDGIYERKGRDITPVMIFVSQPQYAKRYPFYETAKGVFERRFAKHFHDGWQRYVVNRPSMRVA